MVGWHHRLNGHQCEQIPGDSEGRTGQPGVLQSMESPRVRHDRVTEQQQDGSAEGKAGTEEGRDIPMGSWCPQVLCCDKVLPAPKNIANQNHPGC